MMIVEAASQKLCPSDRQGKHGIGRPNKNEQTKLYVVQIRYQAVCRLSQTEGLSMAAAISFPHRALSETPRSSG